MEESLKKWKDIPGFIGKYQANKMGEIRSLSYEGRNIIEKLKQSKRKDGYLQVQLYDKKYLVHRIIAITFLKNKFNFPYVNHIDGNKQNNCVNNLEWCTASQNTIHAYKNNLKKKLFNEQNSNSKVVIQLDINDNIIKKYPSVSEAKRQTKISHISCCCLGTRKTAGGYKWKYEERGLNNEDY